MNADTVPARIGTLARIRNHLRPYRRPFAVLAVASAVTAVIESGIIVTLVPLAQAVATDVDRYAITIARWEVEVAVPTLVALIVGLTLARALGQFVIAVLTGRVVSRYQDERRSTLMGAYLDAAWPVQSTEAAGRLQDTATLQIERGTRALMMACLTLSALASLLILVGAALVLNVFAALAIIVAGGVLSALTRPLSTLAERNSRAMVDNDQEFAGQVEQAVDLARELRVFGGARQFRRHIDRVVTRSRALKANQVRLVLMLPALYQNLAILLVAVGLGLIFWRDLGAVTALATIVLLLVRALAYSQVVQVQYHQLTETLPSLDAVTDKTDLYTDARVDATAGTSLGRVDEVAFDDVHFAYDGSGRGLHGLSFRAGQGDVVGIIGPSGAGKSTIVQLLLGLREPTAGAVRVNGHDLRGVARRDWHHRIGFVPQEPQLIEGSIADNIRFYRDELTDDQVTAASRRAQVHERIMTWPDGYGTEVRDFGGRLSGGERQRVCVARALAAGPDILVFDEPTSSLDPSSAEAVHQSLRELADDFLLFLVAHDPHSLRLCTHVLVVIDGGQDFFGPVELARRESSYVRGLAIDGLADEPGRLR